jgi:hypothetical protein
MLSWPGSCTKPVNPNKTLAIKQAMCKNKQIPLLILVILTGLLSLWVTGCAPFESVSASAGEETNQDSQSAGQPVVAKQVASSQRTASAQIVVFEGSIFVASTDLVNERWLVAGWKISTQSIDTDSHPVPLDCTLYPHFGVENQWVGSCSGRVKVPQDGARNIAVMHTKVDGSTILVQVAP